MTITQAKALRVGQRVTDIRTKREGYVSFTSRSGVAVTFYGEGLTQGYSWPYVWPLHIL